MDQSRVAERCPPIVDCGVGLFLPRKSRDNILPSIFLVEFWSALARRTGSVSEARERVSRVERDSIFDVVPIDRRLIFESTEVAISLQLRGADAIYPAFAQQLNVPLVTWDHEQRLRAGKIIEAISPAQALEMCQNQCGHRCDRIEGDAVTRVGMREFRTHLSAILRRVRDNGETFEITGRCKPVAILRPMKPWEKALSEADRRSVLQSRKMPSWLQEHTENQQDTHN